LHDAYFYVAYYGRLHDAYFYVLSCLYFIRCVAIF